MLSGWPHFLLAQPVFRAKAAFRGGVGVSAQVVELVDTPS